MLKKFILLFLIFLSSARVYSQISIGVALPLMNGTTNLEEKRLGEQMLKGIKDALQEYNNNDTIVEVNIKVEDTKRDQTNTLNIINQFGSDKSVIAILGPVFSSELINNVGAAAFHKISIITPTATHNFLAMQNEFIYQLNPTYDIRGKIMAKFAMNELGMKNFVIFSEESYGKNFSESFADEVKETNGNIFSIINYSKDKQDLTEELSRLKSKILEKEKFLDFGGLDKKQMEKIRKLKFQFSYFDSLLNEKSIVSIYKLFGKNADKILDSSGITTITNPRNKENLILGYIDAVYIPIANFNEISKIAPQYFSENINLPILGTSDWNNEKILDENRMYIKMLYFDSDFYIKGQSTKKSTNFTEIEKKNYYFGYDTMKLILDKILEGNHTRISLSEALEKVNNYKSVHNNITIKERTNHQMSIMIFKKGELMKITDYIY